LREFTNSLNENPIYSITDVKFAENDKFVYIGLEEEYFYPL